MIRGGRRRRHQCHACALRWTTWSDAPPLQGKEKRSLTLDQILLVLTSPLKPRLLAEMVGRHVKTINSIQRGDLHGEVLPELPRRRKRRVASAGLSCRNCIHWSTAATCGLGFPDPLEEGLAFAADCSNYQIQ